MEAELVWREYGEHDMSHLSASTEDLGRAICDRFLCEAYYIVLFLCGCSCDGSDEWGGLVECPDRC